PVPPTPDELLPASPWKLGTSSPLPPSSELPQPTPAAVATPSAPRLDARPTQPERRIVDERRRRVCGEEGRGECTFMKSRLKLRPSGGRETSTIEGKARRRNARSAGASTSSHRAVIELVARNDTRDLSRVAGISEAP